MHNDPKALKNIFIILYYVILYYYTFKCDCSDAENFPPYMQLTKIMSRHYAVKIVNSLLKSEETLQMMTLCLHVGFTSH
jgi:hypothetical protein